MRYDAILLDVDHSPRHQLDPSHADLYTPSGLRAVAAHLAEAACSHCGRMIRPTTNSSRVLAAVFAQVQAHIVNFANPLTGGTSSNTVYVATRTEDRLGGPPR